MVYTVVLRIIINGFNHKIHTETPLLIRECHTETITFVGEQQYDTPPALLTPCPHVAPCCYMLHASYMLDIKTRYMLHATMFWRNKEKI